MATIINLALYMKTNLRVQGVVSILDIAFSWPDLCHLPQFSVSVPVTFPNRIPAVMLQTESYAFPALLHGRGKAESAQGIVIFPQHHQKE